MKSQNVSLGNIRQQIKRQAPSGLNSITGRGGGTFCRVDQGKMQMRFDLIPDIVYRKLTDDDNSAAQKVKYQIPD